MIYSKFFVIGLLSVSTIYAMEKKNERKDFEEHTALKNHVMLEYGEPSSKKPAQQERSKRVFFVSECLVNQNIRANGVQNLDGQGPVAPLINLFVSRGVGFTVVDCPEVPYEGLARRACGKSRYQTDAFVACCLPIVNKVVARYKMYLHEGYKVGGFVCINGSPTCAIDYCFNHGRCYEPGIFIEQLNVALSRDHLTMNFIGYDKWNIRNVVGRINAIMDAWD